QLLDRVAVQPDPQQARPGAVARGWLARDDEEVRRVRGPGEVDQLPLPRGKSIEEIASPAIEGPDEDLVRPGVRGRGRGISVQERDTLAIGSEGQRAVRITRPDLAEYAARLEEPQLVLGPGRQSLADRESSVDEEVHAIDRGARKRRVERSDDQKAQP